MTIIDASHLSNEELASALPRLAGGERAATVALIAHLGEFEARRLHAEAGFPSSFAYCREVLHLSEDAALYRIKAPRGRLGSFPWSWRCWAPVRSARRRPACSPSV
jgi:hypothetical protein